MTAKRPRRWPISLAAIVVLQCAVYSCGAADALLLHPSRDPIGVALGVERREIAFGGGKLDTWVASSKRGAAPEAYVLAFDGNASRAEACASRVADLFDDRSVQVWAVNYPGYGASDGEAELDRLAPAALVAYDELVRVADGKPIFVYGNSMGATVALHVVTKRPVAMTVLQNPPPLRRLILWRHGWWNLWLLALPIALSLPGELDAVSSAETARVPAVFVTAEQDSIVPPSHQDVVYESYGGPKRRVFAPGGHNDRVDAATQESVRSAVREFVK
ncbi:MAG: alpha/beta fold hydrolase [Planctomycetes bacterium]|nr:alpha/beta fold hydrolase [Planctomycetota bacterium]